MKIYKINDEKFKSIFVSYNFTMPVKDKSVFANNAVLGALMAKSSKEYSNQKEIEKYLNKLYGAYYDVNIDKYGDLYNLEFKIEYINRKFLPNKEDLSFSMLEFLKSMIYGPADWTEENIDREKKFICERINERKDEKLKYAVQRVEELLCKDEPYGNYLYGDIESVKKVDKKVLLDTYRDLINSNVTVIISGNLSGYEDIDKEITKIFEDKINNNNNSELSNLIINTRKNNNIEYEEVKEYQDTAQSVLAMGYKLEELSPDDFYAFSVYNAILGTTPSSKLFQNVREKASLAYTVRSKGYRFKNMLVIYAGINKENYSKALNLINEQVEAIKKGDISDIELNSAVDSLIADFKSINDSKRSIALFTFANILAFGSDNITLDDMIKKFSNITKDDVVEIAKKVELEKVFYIGGDTNE